MQLQSKDVLDTINRPMRDLRLSVTDRCNFRCHYCMPADRYDENYKFLERDEYLTFDEMERLARLFVRSGVRKIRLTGGEPLLRKNLDNLVGRLSLIEGVEDLALITNGYFLSEYAEGLKKAGLNRVTVSLDSLDCDIFEHMNGRGIGLKRVLDGITKASEAGLMPVKINVVLQRHINDNSLLDFAAFARRTGHIIRFIEYMDVGSCNGWAYREVVPTAEVRDIINARYPLVALGKQYEGEVADRYKFEDGKGEIGFISSISNPFCGECTRARLSADGKLYTCLFATEGTDLKTMIRSGASDDDLQNQIRSIWKVRDDRYSELRDISAGSELQEQGRDHQENRIEMYHVGG